MSYLVGGINTTGKVIDALQKNRCCSLYSIKYDQFGTVADINGYFELIRLFIENPILIISIVDYN